MTSYLVIGRSGQVARALADIASELGVEVTFRGTPDCDFERPDSVVASLDEMRPDLVINAGAYTAVDKAESEAARAHRINAEGPAHLAQLCAARGVPLLHISTDYVFDGSKDGAYREDDAPNPLGVYGASKLAGEQAIAAALDRHLILRTSWVFDGSGRNFLNTMLRLASERDRLTVVDDQIGGPTGARAIAQSLLTMAETALRPGFDDWGLYHFQGRPVVSWCGFAREIFRQWQARSGMPVPEVAPIATADYPTPARRPLRSVLEMDRIGRVFGIAPADWQAELGRYLDAKSGG